MFFFINSADPDIIHNLVTTYKGRVTVNSGTRPHIAVKMKDDKPLTLMQGVVDILGSDEKQ
jgi:hypothetical protein